MTIKKYELIREEVENWRYNCSLSNDDEVAGFLTECLKMHKKDREQFVTLSMNTKGEIIGVAIDSIGVIDSSLVHPREIFKQAILCNVRDYRGT